MGQGIPPEIKMIMITKILTGGGEKERKSTTLKGLGRVVRHSEA